MRRFLAAATCILAAVLAVAPTAHAEESACTGVLTGQVAGDVVVPSGASCTLEGAEISGSVTVEPAGQLWGHGTIGGSVELRADARLGVSDSTIGGDLVCRACRAMSMSFMYGIGGDVRVTGMTDGYLSWDGVPVAGSVKVTGNSGSFAFIDTLAQGNFVFADNIGTAGFCTPALEGTWSSAATRVSSGSRARSART